MFFAAIFVFASGFLLRAQQANKPSSVISDAPKDFDIAAAMKLAYGGYDVATKSVTVDVPEGAGKMSDFFNNVDHVTVRPFWTASALEADASEVFLLTQAAPQQGRFDCHACAPLIGAFAFAKANGSWKVVASSRAAAVFGAWGNPAEPRLVVIGPHRRGVSLETSDMHQGFTDSALIVLLPWKGTFGNALLASTGSGDSGSCGPQSEPGALAACFSNRRTLRLVPGRNSDYFDLRLVLSGTDISSGKLRVTRKVSGVETFRFQDGKYVSVSRTGDTTSVESNN
jgi:hypothetical protein